MENLQSARTVTAAVSVIKMLPIDASDGLKETIGDILHNEVEELYLEDNGLDENNISDAVKQQSESDRIVFELEF